MHFHIISILLVNVYIPPGSPLYLYEGAFECIEQLMTTSSAVLIAGDFNVPEFYDCWHKSGNATNIFSSVISFMNFSGIEQYNEVTNSSDRLLDLVFSNVDSCTVSHLATPVVVEDAHHPALFVEVVFPVSGKSCCNIASNSTESDCDFSRVDIQSLYGAMAVKGWTHLLATNDVNACSDLLTVEILSMFDLYVP